jgi:hypothetical protein
MPEPTPPSHRSDGFDCPWCRAFAHQVWFDGYGRVPNLQFESFTRLSISQCTRCAEQVFWVNEKMVHPLVSTAPPPNADLPDDVRADYVEAASILPYSTRSSAALLRLAIQKLCESLGEPGNLNAAIGALVKKGLSTMI